MIRRTAVMGEPGSEEYEAAYLLYSVNKKENHLTGSKLIVDKYRVIIGCWYDTTLNFRALTNN